MVLSWSDPDHRMESLFFAVRLAVEGTVERMKHRLFSVPDEEAEDFAVVYSTVSQSHVLTRRANLVNSGCRNPGPSGTILGEQLMLNYATVAAQYNFWKSRVTVWMAPQLGCFALRVTVEREQPDGSWTLSSEKKAVRVAVSGVK